MSEGKKKDGGGDEEIIGGVREKESKERETKGAYQ